MALISCYYGSVNRWECDENDHLNVRFYAQKINQSVDVFLHETLGTNSLAIVGQHIRFVQEARIATPLRVDCALLAVGPGFWDILSLMHQNLTDTPVAGFITRVAGEHLASADAPVCVSAPDWAAPRGLDPEHPFPLPLSAALAIEQGFLTMGRGVIGRAECDDQGVALPEVYIGRISDGMPNLWAFTSDSVEAEQRQSGALGGAALEYQLDVLAPLNNGDVFSHVSGIRKIGNKTQHMVHLLLNETRDEIALRAEAIGVGMDLETRRAVPISATRRAQLEGLLVPR